MAQTDLYTPLNIEQAYNNGSRDRSGMPGSNYWQNRAEYQIDVKLEPKTSKISGSETVEYFNNSPDTLKQVVVSVMSDILKKGNPNDFSIPLAALNDGVIFNKLLVNGEEVDQYGSKVNRRGTNLIIKLEDYLLPGASIQLSFDWSFIYPKGVTIRCGDYGDSTFFAAYFYPKIAVYDDLDGWDVHNYTGFAETYGDHSDYNVRISVPRDFKVWATGELQNAEKVFSEAYYSRWKEAQKSDTVYRFLHRENYLDDQVTAKDDWIEWHFIARNVPDFAFGSSNQFLWDMINVVVDEKSGRKTTLNTAYRIDSEDYYKLATLGKKILQDYSTRIPGIPYPFPEMTIFNGNSGMEFPMMCNNVSCEPWHESASLAYHEIAHTYFPFFVGTNERKYAWMDEGWANLFPYFFLNEHSPDFDYIATRKSRYFGVAGSEIEVPIMTLGDILTIRAPYRQASYNKSFFAYYYLYDFLGAELFLECLKTYMNAWAGKHPMPYDFYNSFSNSSGKDLDWYWQNWFFERNHADLGIDFTDDGKFRVYNKGRLFLPVDLTVVLKNGETIQFSFPADIWKNSLELMIPVENWDIESIELGNDKIIDVNLSNNKWSAK